MCTANTWPVFIALGRPWINTALTALGIVVLIPLLLWSVPQAGTIGAAWALVTAAAIVLAANLVATLRLLSVSSRVLVAQIWRALAAVLAMAGAMLGVEAVMPDGEGLLAIAASLAGTVITGATTYWVSLWLLWRLTGFVRARNRGRSGCCRPGSGGCERVRRCVVVRFSAGEMDVEAH